MARFARCYSHETADNLFGNPAGKNTGPKILTPRNTFPNITTLQDNTTFGFDYRNGASSVIDHCAERMLCYLLCAATGISSQTIDNSASYIKGRLEVLREDVKHVVQAGAAAQKALDMILEKVFQEKELIHLAA